MECSGDGGGIDVRTHPKLQAGVLEGRQIMVERGTDARTLRPYQLMLHLVIKGSYVIQAGLPVLPRILTIIYIVQC